MASSYVIRAWRQTLAGHWTATVVDGRGHVVQVTMPARTIADGDVHALIVHRLDSRGPKVKLP